MAEPENNKLKYFTYFIRFLKCLSVLMLMLNIASSCMILKSTVESKESNQDKAFSFLAQFGFIVIDILLILAEFEPKWFVKLMYLFHYWLGRGFGLMWIGVQCINSVNQAANASSSSAGISPDTLRTVGQVAGWTLISVGSLYVLFSILCLKSLLGIDNVEELEVSLLTGETSKGGSGGGGGGSSYDEADRKEDLELISNVAMAMGISEKDVRRKFAGKNGVKEAKAHAAEVQKMMNQLSSLATAAPAAALGAAKGKVDTLVRSDSLAGPKQYDPPVATERKKNTDDDDLEAAYYAQHTQQ